MKLEEADVLVRLGHGESFARRILLSDFLSLEDYKELLNQNLIKEGENISKTDGKDEKFYLVELTEEGKNFIKDLTTITNKELSIGLYELGWLLRIACGNVTELNIWRWTPFNSTLYEDLEKLNYIERDHGSKFIKLTTNGIKMVSKVINQVLEK